MTTGRPDTHQDPASPPHRKGHLFMVSKNARIQQAADNARSELFTQGFSYVENLPAGYTFTAADVFEYIAPHADDHPSRHGALIRALQQKQLIEFAGYGPARRPAAWDAPSRMWRRTDINLVGDAA